MTLAILSHLLEAQAGVVTRRQAELLGATAADLRRLVRRRELARVHPGTYVNHTGPPTWLQRAWAAVLHAEPAALCHASAIRAADGPGRVGWNDSVIHVAVSADRRLRGVRGVRIHRLTRLDEWTLWNTGPPRVRTEHAVLDVSAEAAGEHEAIAVLADAVQSRRTTAARLRAAIEEHPSLRRRAFLADVLADVDHGACSVLEVGYLRQVERAHGLPHAERQVRDSTRGPLYRDVEYTGHGLVVELDGRLFHDSARGRHADLVRDLDAAVAGKRTVRVGWGQVFGDPCRTAESLARLLGAAGWSGATTRCVRCS
jgi:hypothetical protein